jgi:carboxypeptidase Taq
MASTLSSNAVSKLKDRLYDLNALNAAQAVMDWDQQCYMPQGGAEARAEQLGILSRMGHEYHTSDETGRLIEEAAREASTDEERALVRVAKRNFDLATKIPASLVAEKTRVSSIAHEDWVRARKNNDFASFAPILERMFDFSRQEAEYLGYKDHIYDALLDQYEEGATQADCRRMFDKLKGPNKALIDALVAAPNQPDDSKLYGSWDEAKQRAFTEQIVRDIGFSFENGRQDTAPHPFCTNFSVRDVRLTTRFKDYIGSAIFGSLHEAGHGMYEQGSPVEWDRTPLAGGVSLGVHESQSRTWENIVGRSRAFWQRYLPVLQQSFPELSGFDLDNWLRAVNKVQPSFIRVEADEVTYNMHIIVRFELECALLTGELAVKDLPEAWNAKYEEYLGIRPSTDSEGCLQDVHWSAALIGYFPTYSMGNLLSYQIWNCLVRDLGDVDGMIASGNFAPILGWLQDNVYKRGSMYPPKQLVEMVTGKPMDSDDYIAGLTAKYRNLYGLS